MCSRQQRQRKLFTSVQLTLCDTVNTYTTERAHNFKLNWSSVCSFMNGTCLLKVKFHPFLQVFMHLSPSLDCFQWPCSIYVCGSPSEPKWLTSPYLQTQGRSGATAPAASRTRKSNTPNESCFNGTCTTARPQLLVSPPPTHTHTGRTVGRSGQVLLILERLVLI